MKVETIKDLSDLTLGEAINSLEELDQKEELPQDIYLEEISGKMYCKLNILELEDVAVD